jgi:exosortase A-associated hydrolase 1
MAISFQCSGSQLVGILHRPDAAARRGVVIVVGGGPQYRVGGHRQLVLWGRRLAAAGYPALRFDYRGMGDSYGEFRGFEDIHEDIRCAVDRLQQEYPDLQEIVLWGECDASSAIIFYAHSDPRVKGIVLLNPWARTEAGQARAMLKHYYLQRLLEPSFWKKVGTLRFNPVESLTSLMAGIGRLMGTGRADATNSQSHSGAPPATAPLPARLFHGLRRYQGKAMLVMSGRDYIAKEFDELIKAEPRWAPEFQRISMARLDIPEGDHTFSSAAQRDKVVGFGLEWLRSW